MSVRIMIAALIYMMVQAIMFGAGAVLVLATPLADMAMRLMPLVVAGSIVLALPVAWHIAPRLRARYWRARGDKPDFLSGASGSAFRRR
jgi:hypothetical protein